MSTFAVAVFILLYAVSNALTVTVPFCSGGVYASAPNGNMFDVQNIGSKDLTITRFSVRVNIQPTDDWDVTIYSKTGSHVGSEGTSLAWTVIHQETQTGSQPSNQETLLSNLQNTVSLAPSEIRAFFVYVEQATVFYCAGTTTGALLMSDSNLAIFEGNVIQGFGEFIITPRQWQGSVYYSLAAGMSTSPTTNIPTTSFPTTLAPITSQPSTSQPSTSQPTTTEPTTLPPSTTHSTITMNPTLSPITFDPTMIPTKKPSTQIIDHDGVVIESTESLSGSGKTDLQQNNDSLVLMVLVIVIVIVIVMILCFYLYWKRIRNKQLKVDSNANNLQMADLNIYTSNINAEGQQINKDEVVSDDDMVGIINETNGNMGYVQNRNNDDDILKAINASNGHDDMNNDGAILQAVNETCIGDNDGDFEVVETLDKTRYGLEENGENDEFTEGV